MASVLWLDPPETHDLMKSTDQALCLDQGVDAASTIHTLTLEERPSDSTRLIVLFYPKAKRRLDWWLKHIESLALGCPIWVLGENNGGIKSLPKRTVHYLECEKVDNARHCVLFQCHFNAPMPEPETWLHYETNEHQIGALPGVFSQEKLDAGTRLLLEHLPGLKGTLFELGCGAGAITLALLSNNEQCEVVSSDIDLLAVKSTQRNIARAGFEERCNVIWSDGMSQVPNQRFDALITNPPFHIGIKTHYAPTERFFTQADQWLKRGGMLWWVANDFLDYQSLLGPSFNRIEEITHRSGFRVFKAVRA